MFGEEQTNAGNPSSGILARPSPAAAKSKPYRSTSPSSKAAIHRTAVESPAAPAPTNQPKSVKDIIKALDEEQDVAGPKGSCCSRMFVPFLTVGLIVIVFIAIVFTNGTSTDVQATPRVALIIMDGFSGPVFHSLMQSGIHLPNIANMLSTRGGIWASCIDATASSCARSVVVEDDANGTVYVNAAASMASILSGVSPHSHKISTDALESMSIYANTSKTYPSLAKRVVDAGGRVTVIGTSHILNSLNSSTGSCSQPGVLDMECGGTKEEVLQNGMDSFTGSIHLDCLATSSCNINTRKTKTPTNPQTCTDGNAETQFHRQLASIFGGLAYATPEQTSASSNAIADELDDTLFVFHFDALAVRASSAALPNFSYSASSAQYVAQAYILDALVGQVLSYVRDRARSQKENWLVLGLSDHGGSKKEYGGSASSTVDSAISFFMATYTTNTKGYISLSSLNQPISQLDVLPTVLTWLDVAPFDNMTTMAVKGTNTTVLSEEVVKQVAQRAVFEGQVQGICSSGTALVDCTS